ncbi:hypothetical protein C0J52_28248 [Blattella germanica]|nr:hypothetical protein C0J52_28248 [Blattella germanica]
MRIQYYTPMLNFQSLFPRFIMFKTLLMLHFSQIPKYTTINNWLGIFCILITVLEIN